MDVKVCGLTCVEDARAAQEMGADCLGFVLHADSPRGIDPARMWRILDRLPGSVRAVAVVVNETRRYVERLMADGPLRAVQLHGEERGEDLQDLPVALWRAVRFEMDGRISPAPADWSVERWVVDAAVPGARGGTGKTADWAAAAEWARRACVMLAGGLTPENVGAAIRAVAPAGVDVASGVEREPGRKDYPRMRAFIRQARLAADELERATMQRQKKGDR